MTHPQEESFGVNTNENTSANLPVAVKYVGGALETVVRDIQKYTDPSFQLTDDGIRMLARIVEEQPDFNTEARVALLVDAIAYHGVDQRKEFLALVEQFPVEDVYLAIDYLYEIGTRGRGSVHQDDEKEKRSRRMSLVGEIVEIIIRLREFEFEVDSVEALDSLVYELGGRKKATEASEEDLAELYHNKYSPR